MPSRRQRRKAQQTIQRNVSANRSRRSSRRMSLKWRFLLIGGSSLLILCLLGLLVGFVMVKNYLASEELRNSIAREVGKATDTKVRIESHRWKGSELFAPTLSARGRGQTEAFDLAGISAKLDFSKAWGGVWQINELNFDQASITLDKRTVTPDPLAPPPPPAPPTTSAKSNAKKPNFLAKYLPNETRVDDIQVGNFSTQIRTDLGLFKLTNSQLSATSFEGLSDSRQVRLSGGDLLLPIGPIAKSRLQNAGFRVDQERILLNQASLRVGNTGLVNLSGSWDIEDQRWRLTGSADTIDTNDALPPTWSQTIKGQIDANFSITKAAESPPLIEGQLDLLKTSLSGMTLLDSLAAYTNKPQFKAPALEEGNFRFRIQADKIELRSINLYSRNLARIEGNLTIDGEQLDGIFQVGIPPGTLAFIPGAESKVFTSTQNGGKMGWLWTTVRISGTKTNWADDLTERLIQAAGERMFEMIPETGERLLKFSQRSVRDLTRDPANLPNTVIDEANNLLHDTLPLPRGLNPGLIPLPTTEPAPTPQPEPEPADR